VEDLCELHRVAVPCDMHVHGGGLGAEEVVMQSRHFDSVLDQHRHHRIDLVMGQDQVAHDHGLIAHGLEGEPGAEREARLDVDAVERDLQVRARQADAVDAARRHRAFLAEGFADRLPVRLGRSRSRNRKGE
jgi:hypothetical protein